MLSLEECAPNRPPRWQKLPGTSGAVQFDTIIGRFSIETSANHTICRASRHSFRIASSTLMTISRLAPSLSRANSAIGMPSMGQAVVGGGEGGVVGVEGVGGVGEGGGVRHAPGAPVGCAGDQEGDAGVAFPPVLVCVLQPVQPRDQPGIGRVGDIPDLMRLAAEGA